MIDRKGAKAEDLTIGQVAEITTKQMSNEQSDAASKRTLKIWDVPTELASKFISVARGNYANKSWLYLQDLVRKAEQYDLMVSSGRLDTMEKQIVNIEESLNRINKVFEDAQKDEIETQEKKVPKTFGGTDE